MPIIRIGKPSGWLRREQFGDLGGDVVVLQPDAAAAVDHHLTQHSGPDVRCDDHAVRMLFGQSAERQAAAAKTESVTALATSGSCASTMSAA